MRNVIGLCIHEHVVEAVVDYIVDILVGISVIAFGQIVGFFDASLATGTAAKRRNTAFTAGGVAESRFHSILNAVAGPFYVAVFGKGAGAVGLGEVAGSAGKDVAIVVNQSIIPAVSVARRTHRVHASPGRGSYAEPLGLGSICRYFLPQRFFFLIGAFGILPDTLEVYSQIFARFRTDALHKSHYVLEGVDNGRGVVYSQDNPVAARKSFGDIACNPVECAFAIWQEACAVVLFPVAVECYLVAHIGLRQEFQNFIVQQIAVGGEMYVEPDTVFPGECNGTADNRASHGVEVHERFASEEREVEAFQIRVPGHGVFDKPFRRFNGCRSHSAAFEVCFVAVPAAAGTVERRVYVQLEEVVRIVDGLYEILDKSCFIGGVLYHESVFA